jgi:ABC-type polar amino acid transport system ATPase subunit
VIYNSLDAYPAEMDTLQQFCIALARGVVSNHRIILVEDLEMMKNMKYIEDYLGILKILNQKKHITMILSMLNNQYLSLFDKFFYI